MPLCPHSSLQEGAKRRCQPMVLVATAHELPAVWVVISCHRSLMH
jgi:hypothetical protein